MAIGDLATASSDTTASSLTYAHSVAGSSLLCLWVCVDSFRSSGSSDPTGVTYAAAAATKISNYAGGGGNDNFISLWRKIAPATGSNNVVVTHSASHDITAMSISYSGVDQTTPNDAVSQNDVSSDNPSQAVSSATNDQVVSFVCGWNAAGNAVTATGGLTSRLQNMNSSGVNSVAVGDAPGAASVTCSWTANWNGTTDGHGEMNFNVNVDAGGGPATLTGTASPSITLTLGPNLARQPAQATPSITLTLGPNLARQPAQSTPSITLSLAPNASATLQAQATPSITLSLAPSAFWVARAQASPSITLSLAPNASATLRAQATPSITLSLAPVGVWVARAQATPSITLSLSASAAALATAAPSIKLTLAPSGRVIGLATATPSITLSLGPVGLKVGLATVAPSITLSLAPAADRVAIGTAAPSILLTLSPEVSGVAIIEARTVLPGENIPVVIADSFDRANNASSLGTTDTGQVWSALTGTWGVSSNTAVVSGAGADRLVVVESGSADATLQATLVVTGVGVAGLAFRVQDANNFLAVRLLPDDSFVQVIRRVVGVFSSLDVGVYSPAASNLLRIDAVGSRVQCSVDGLLVNDLTITDFQSATQHGLYALNGPVATWNDFSITGLLPSPPTITLTLAPTAQVISTATIYTASTTANEQGLREEAISYRGSP